LSPFTGSGRAGLRLGILGLGFLALVLSGYGLVRHNNWYLASDQAAFLTMARDIRSGTVFHDATIFAETVPAQRPGKTYDALQQTYFLRGDKLYSRYPPGFPVLLAMAGAMGGETAEHWLNPVLYLASLLVLAGLLLSVLGGYDRLFALAVAVLAVWMVLLVPTGIHLWGITVARDLPAHGFGLLAILLAVRRRPAGSGLALAAAALIRPDALLYASSILAVAACRPPSRRAVVGWLVALLAGLLPLLAYNFVTQGHPLAFTQGGEFVEVLSWVLPGAVHAAPEAVVAVSGGGFRLSNLSTTLPGNLRLLWTSFGALFLFPLAGVAWAGRCRPLAVAALLPYPLLAIFFYSCWVHPDARYLAGASFCLLGLAALGGMVVARFFLSPRLAPSGRIGLVAAVLLLVLWQQSDRIFLSVPPPGPVFVAVLASGALVAVLRRWLRDAAAWALLAPTGMLALIAVFPMLEKSPGWGPFREPQTAAARAYVAEQIPPGSFVLASPALGRPAENLRVYSGVEAFYPAEFALLDTNPETAALLALAQGRRVFVLVDGREVLPSVAIPGLARQVLVDFIPPHRALEVFADPRRVPFGVRLYEWGSFAPAPDFGPGGGASQGS
jgi:hypothetical protein